MIRIELERITSAVLGRCTYLPLDLHAMIYSIEGRFVLEQFHYWMPLSYESATVVPDGGTALREDTKEHLHSCLKYFKNLNGQQP